LPEVAGVFVRQGGGWGAAIAAGPVAEWLANAAPELALSFQAARDQARRESDAG
jgi:hypothetical protein